MAGKRAIRVRKLLEAHYEGGEYFNLELAIEVTVGIGELDLAVKVEHAQELRNILIEMLGPPLSDPDCACLCYLNEKHRNPASDPPTGFGSKRKAPATVVPFIRPKKP